MADTIISNTPRSGDDSGSAGWVVALVIVFAVIFGSVFIYQRGFFGTATPNTTPDTTNINVTVPEPTIPVTTTPDPIAE